jgi:hypothetical protein
MSEMQRVDRAHKCPICDHDTWCLLGRSVVICMRQTSSKPKNFKGGEVGYLHDYPNGDRKPKYEPTPREKPPAINARKVLWDWKRAYPNDKLAMLADNLGVTIRSLEEMECQVAGGYVSTWAFPMKDGYGNYIGIRLRNLAAQKWAVTGSQAGIFVPKVTPQKRMLVVEGPTDCAAGLTLGIYTVGRPSCSGGVTHIVDHVRKQKIIREVVIAADNDTPGIKGATDLQKWLPVPSCVMLLPTKDLREFIKFGDKSTIDSMIEQTVWTQPKENK